MCSYILTSVLLFAITDQVINENINKYIEHDNTTPFLKHLDFFPKK